MSNPVSSLPEAWIEKIWATMRATYGASFDRQWQCPVGTEPLDHVMQLKQAWGRQLAGFQQQPNAIGYALDNLPPHPPNLIEFRALMRRAPADALPMLEGPKADPERVAAELAKLSHIRTAGQVSDGKEWARRIVAKHNAGEPVKAVKLQWARDALKVTA